MKDRYNKPDVTQNWYPWVGNSDNTDNVQLWGGVFNSWKEYADKNGYEHGDLKEICYWLASNSVSADDAYRLICEGEKK